MARAETKGFGRACVRRAVNHRAPLAIGKWEASLSWINRRIDDHGNDGFLVPVGDDVGGSGSGRAHHAAATSTLRRFACIPCRGASLA